MIRTLLAAILAIGIAACTSAPIYEAAQDPNDFGYSDQKIEENRYRVTYNGDASTSRSAVENFLLYRMSEITLENGFDYFKVLDTDTECHTEYRATREETCPPASRYGPMFPYCGFGYICNPSQTIKETKRYEAVAYLTLHKGEKPDDDAHAFSARAVQQNLSDQIVRD